MLGCLKYGHIAGAREQEAEHALEPPVCSDFVHNCLDTLSASWAPNLF
jgi:hypothetical protein